MLALGVFLMCAFMGFAFRRFRGSLWNRERMEKFCVYVMSFFFIFSGCSEMYFVEGEW